MLMQTRWLTLKQPIKTVFVTTYWIAEERDFKVKEEKSTKIFYWKKECYLNKASPGLHMMHQVWEKNKSQESINSENNRKGKSQHNQQRW